jgi:hypothetical protein
VCCFNSNVPKATARFVPAQSVLRCYDRRVGALLIGGDAFLRAQGKQLVETAARFAMATMFDEREYVARED